MSTRGQKTTSPPPKKGSLAHAADDLLLEDEDAFDRPTIVPTTPPDELAGALAIGNDPAEDSAILRRGGISQPRIPVFEAPPPSARSAQPSLGEEIDLWGGGSRIPSSPPPRSQLPTLSEPDPLSFDISVSVPPTVPRGRVDELEELDISVPVAPPAEFRFRKSGAQTRPEPFGSSEDTPPSERDAGSALGVVGSRSGPPSSGAPARGRATTGGPTVDMRDRFALGDFTGALVLAETLLEQDPSHAEAARYADSCRERLRQMYAARLGALDRVPRVIVPPDQVRWLSLDHRAGFVLSCVDGYSTIEEILDVSGMPALDALRVLYELLQQRIISVG